MRFLDASGITDLVNKLKTKFQETLISGTNIRTINNESLLGSGNITIDGGGGGGTITTWYGTCSTVASTAAKVVTCTDFTLTTGAIISVLFSTANTANTPTLNVNSTGDKTIYIGASTPDATNSLKWSANTMLTFIYDGTYFRYISSKSASSVEPADGGGAWYGSCSTTASTAAKTSAITNFVLEKGAIAVIYCSTANTVADALTLNINSTGTKNIYCNGSATSSSNPLTWSANETLTFVYDGSYYTFIARTGLPVASTTQLGGVMVDGKTIEIKNNKISTLGGISVATETITIASGDWSSNTCTKSVASLTDACNVFVTYAPDSAADYLAAGIYCSAQSSNTLTFSCTTTPSASVNVNVLVINKPTLRGTTWYFNETIALAAAGPYSINFTWESSNSGKAIRFYKSGRAWKLVYTRPSDSDLIVYDSGMGWTGTNPRTIVITDGADAENPDLIAWLQANATQVS